MEQKFYTVTVYSENQVGLLNQISIIFTRRKLNIESLTVSASSLPGVHKFTITTMADSEEMMIKLVKQIERKVDVMKAFYYTDDEIIFQEVALYKMDTKCLLDNTEIEKMVRRYNAIIMEINRDFTVIEKAGLPEEIQKLFNELNATGGLLQFVRSGRIAITKSPMERVSTFIKEQEERLKEMNITNN
ncbi:acetolactate synthase small subunit [Porphyromonadaceae bacterium]